MSALRAVRADLSNTNQDAGLTLHSSLGLDPQKAAGDTSVRHTAHGRSRPGTVDCLRQCRQSVVDAECQPPQGDWHSRSAGSQPRPTHSQWLSEVLLLVLLSGPLGLFFTFCLNEPLANFLPLPDWQPRHSISAWTPESPALLCSVSADWSAFRHGACLAIIKAELTSMLKHRSGSQFQTLRFHNPLIVGQVALSLVA